MKTSLLFLCVFLLPATTVFSQAMIHIDSVKVQPPNPTPADAVYLHFYGWCGYGAALNGPPSVTTIGNTHNVAACYIVNVLSVITDIHDSVYLFTGPAGVHVVNWVIQQNSDQFTPVCDTLVTDGTDTINVVATSIAPHEGNLFVVSWNAQDHSLLYSLPDNKSRVFSVYTTGGQLITKEQTSGTTGKIKLSTETSGLFIVTLEDENGFVLREKIYCEGN